MNLHLVWSTSVNQKIVSSQSSPSYFNISPLLLPLKLHRPAIWQQTDVLDRQTTAAAENLLFGEKKRIGWTRKTMPSSSTSTKPPTNAPLKHWGQSISYPRKWSFKAGLHFKAVFFRHARWKIQPSLAENETNNVGSVTGISNYKFF